jgi:hypothetical protein
MIKSVGRVLALAAVGIFGGACSSSSTPTCTSNCGETTPDGGSGTGTGSGTGSGSDTVSFSCDQTAKSEGCTIFNLTAEGAESASLEKSACTKDDGTVGTTCPTASIVGCCTTGNVSTGSSVICSYTTDTAPQTKSDCTGAGGTWSTTP